MKAFEDGYQITEETDFTDLLAIQKDHPDWWLVWYAGPGRHPDNVYGGHMSDCATHSTPAYPDGPCTCGVGPT